MTEKNVKKKKKTKHIPNLIWNFSHVLKLFSKILSSWKIKIVFKQLHPVFFLIPIYCCNLKFLTQLRSEGGKNLVQNNLGISCSYAVSLNGAQTLLGADALLMRVTVGGWYRPSLYPLDRFHWSGSAHLCLRVTSQPPEPRESSGFHMMLDTPKDAHASMFYAQLLTGRSFALPGRKIKDLIAAFWRVCFVEQ